ncbi:MAG: hypothetical protein WCI74_07410 [Actinomycetes bacterium]
MRIHPNAIRAGDVLQAVTTSEGLTVSVRVTVADVWDDSDLVHVHNGEPTITHGHRIITDTHGTNWNTNDHATVWYLLGCQQPIRITQEVSPYRPALPPRRSRVRRAIDAINTKFHQFITILLDDI